jgi:hypothetical protein
MSVSMPVVRPPAMAGTAQPRSRHAVGLAVLGHLLTFPYFLQSIGGLLQRTPHGRGIALVGQVNLGRHDRAGVQIHRVWPFNKPCSVSRLSTQSYTA